MRQIYDFFEIVFQRSALKFRKKPTRRKTASFSKTLFVEFHLCMPKTTKRKTQNPQTLRKPDSHHHIQRLLSSRDHLHNNKSDLHGCILASVYNLFIAEIRYETLSCLLKAATSELHNTTRPSSKSLIQLKQLTATIKLWKSLN